VAVRLRALLLAGGAGTRLWPLSTEKRPKQFLRLWDGDSLLKEAYARVHPICEEEVFVATGEQYGDLTLADLRTISSDKLILEPSRRNTGPALLCASLRFARDGDPVTAAIPVDQTVDDAPEFRRCLMAAAEAAEAGTSIVTLGVAPTRPATEYGYVEIEPGPGPARRVRRFVEKPDAAEAAGYQASGRHYWNAGIFVFRPSALLEEARSACPELLAACLRYDEKWRERDDRGEREAYAAIPSVSFDYAVMEKAARVSCVPCEAGWSDVGSYRALKELRGVDACGNLVVSDRPVLAPGVKDFVIVSNDEGTLLMPFAAEAGLREAVAALPGRKEDS
jgi:mannose-1-phosphate guanylyltransferase/mannose-6-phosphate isomerase